MVYDELQEIDIVIKDIKEITKNNLNNKNSDIIDKIIARMKTGLNYDIDINKKKVDLFINDTQHILNSLGEKRWNENIHKDIVEKHSKELKIAFKDLYRVVTDSFYDRYLGTDPKTIKRLR